jgi:hypothetical protein
MSAVVYVKTPVFGNLEFTFDQPIDFFKNCTENFVLLQSQLLQMTTKK